MWIVSNATSGELHRILGTNSVQCKHSEYTSIILQRYNPRGVYIAVVLYRSAIMFFTPL